jgi:aspartyl-tRNA(Asn)/glutamyl-tRNA(Gln) amidotransferase subunit A
VREAFERLLAALAAEQAELQQVAAPALALAWQCYTPIVRAEAAWVHRAALAVGAPGFSERVLPALKAGRALAAADYIDALKARERVCTELDALLAGVDALVLPTSAVLPPLRGQDEIEVEGGRTTVREAVLGQTLPFSLCGLPTLSVPVGLVDGLPMGLQLVGRRDGDAALLALGRWIEAAVGVTPMPPEE